MYIKTFFDGAAVIISEEQDRTCSHPDGHDFSPENGAMFGHNGNCCVHCHHFVGRHEEMRDVAEAQAYAQAMLGATGPVEVRGVEWKWGPGWVRKSAHPGAIDVPTVSLWEKDLELMGIPRCEGVE